nr:PP2C family protein-serine/threonine phosphatase [Prolixibacteraceae bacterium]
VQTPEIANRSEFEIYAISDAAFDLGGDLYDYFLLNENELMFVVADVAGKGIPASLFMIFTHTLLRSIAKSGLAVNEIAENLNSKLITENISDLFVTMFLGILNLKTGIITYTNAAHNSPLLIRHDGVIDELNETHGIPLGIYPNRNYQSSEIQIHEGDQLLVYTDGLTDAKDENDMNFTVDVLKYNLMGAWFNTPEEVVRKIKAEVERFCGTVDPVDDTTLLMLKFKNGVSV